MTDNQALLQRLSNETLHDFEKALEAAATQDDEDFWEQRIDDLETYMEELKTIISNEAQAITA